jgi:hypothetical protein
MFGPKKTHSANGGESVPFAECVFVGVAALLHRRRAAICRMRAAKSWTAEFPAFSFANWLDITSNMPPIVAFSINVLSFNVSVSSALADRGSSAALAAGQNSAGDNASRTTNLIVLCDSVAWFNRPSAQ